MKKNATKRIFTLLLAAMLVLPFASCGGEYPESKETEPAVTKPKETMQQDVEPQTQKIAFEIQGYTCTVYGAKDKILFFTNKEELDAYYEANSEVLGSEFTTFCEKYDDAYFEDRVLIGTRYVWSGTEEYVEHSFEKQDAKYVWTITIGYDTDRVVPWILNKPSYYFIEPEAGHDITVSNLEIKWVSETVE